MNIAILLLALSLLLAPLLSAIPDETQWSAILGVLVIIVGIVVSWRRKSAAEKPERRSTASMLAIAFVAWAILSTLGHAAVTKLAFLSTMLTTTATLVAYTAAFLSIRALAKASRGAAYAAALAAIIGGTIGAVVGVQEYLMHWRAGEPTWRIFGLSSPDFLAGYLVLLIPVTIAVILALPRGNSLRMLAGLAAIVQVAAMLFTQSRFALISIAVGLIVLAAAMARSRAVDGKRAKLSPASIGIAVVLILCGAILAKPVIHRIMAGGNENSGQFRLYTWRGTGDMAMSSPLIGTGPGTFVYRYPKFAKAGFTRLAHDSYLQVAAEMGVPALLILAALIAVLIGTIWRFLSNSGDDAVDGLRSSRSGGDGWGGMVLANLPPNSSRTIAAGLLAGLVAEALQNFIDSDLYVFAIGLTFWAFAGLAAGIAEPAAEMEAQPNPSTPALRWAATALLMVTAAYSLMTGLAARDAVRAQSILADPQGSAADAASAYRAAESMAPLDGKYPAELGYRVLIEHAGDDVGGIAEIRRGVERQPDSQNYLRLGEALGHTGDTAGAKAAYLKGLDQDRNRLELLLDLAQSSSPTDALTYYRRIADLEQSPVGRVRAIGEVTEQRFAIGDSAVADDAVKRGDTSAALLYYKRAVNLLEHYADEGGSTFPERMAATGSPSPADDQQSATLYQHASTALLGLLAGPARDSFTAEQQYYNAKFSAVIGDAFHAIGRLSDAKTAYQTAQYIIASCSYPKAAALKSKIDAAIAALGQ